MFRLFGRRNRPDDEAIVQERWETGFGVLSRNRFASETTPDFSGRARWNGLELSLNRKHLFAWMIDPIYRYRDFVLEAELSLGAENGYSAAGFLFRYINEENYYYVLVSSRGYYRFDLLFNRNPIPLIGWTPLTFAAERGGEGLLPPKVFLRIIANGDHFAFCVDDLCIAEIDDDRLDAGRIAFGGQNYEEREQAVFHLHRILVDSRGLAVQTHYTRWTEELPPPADERITLARTLFAMGAFPATIVQLRKALKEKLPTADELFLLAECQVNLQMYQPALENIEKSLALDPDRAEAIQEKANLLYLTDRFLELRDYLAPRLEGMESSTLWNLYGHAEFTLGNWERAAAAYERAAQAEPEMPIYAVNEAHALERQGRTSEAVSRYLVAARLFLRQEAYDDLDNTLVKVGSLDANAPAARELKGKLAFHYEEYAQAQTLFRGLIDEGYRESGTLYLLGLILSQAGKRAEADPLLAEAAQAEPTYPLFWFRLAENRHLLGRDPEPALGKALELAGEDAWILNLAGQVALEGGRPDEAERHLAKANALAPSEIDIGINLAEARFQAGNTKAAFATLDLLGDDAMIHNQRGNFHARMGHPGAAVTSYEKALSRKRDDPVIMENLAAACLECDLVSRSEELLARVMEIAPSVSVLNRIGNLARLKGEYPRAEVSYRQAIEIDPDNLDMRLNLAELYLDRLKYTDARRLAQEVLARRELPRSPGPVTDAPPAAALGASDAASPVSLRAVRLLERLRRMTEVRFSCATCGKEWWAPRQVEEYGVLRLQGEPPGDSPAGQCPSCGSVYCVSCAKERVRDNRFVCPKCGENLKLSDDHLKYLVLQSLEEASVADRSDGLRGDRP